MTWSDGKDAVLFALALYGAGLSTFNLLKAIQKDKRSIRVICGSKIPVRGDQFGDVWAHIQATNLGQRPVTVTGMGLMLDNGSRLASVVQNKGFGIQDTGLPATLSDGQTAAFHFTYLEIGSALIQSGSSNKTRLIPFAEDSAGRPAQGKAVGRCSGRDH
ncbi:hypothetical protein H8A95_34130 [Bradyrhizobium sp. Pear76]|uniref:hypothetical protein n=1 Tax=Bradyrhizobium oropedii TaxID=1571201 RepID=UPI001E3D2179|nr:hypothetical protein [Bradyrhizobium oropedii]MCC8967234.1 hypothetical protein [Bradyrhizobium oropedii]